MACSNGGPPLIFLLVLASVLQMTRSQEICQIHVDTARGVWRDVTPSTASDLSSDFEDENPYFVENPYCVGYLYQQRDLACTTSSCPSGVSVGGLCSLYINADKYFPCLSTCDGNCNICPPGGGVCPCQRGEARYQEARMCVPYDCVRSCINGWCDGEGRCSCNGGFNKDLIHSFQCGRIDCPDSESVGYCQSECRNSSCNRENGWCDDGECKCFNGFEKDPNNRYKCVVESPDPENIVNLKQRACLDSDCTHFNGRCEHGECKCEEGFKESFSKYRCEPITCPDANEPRHCTAECAKRCSNGRCSSDGTCRCNPGYVAHPSNEYACTKIGCPSKTPEDDSFCISQCIANCANGTCGYRGVCNCNFGYKKEPNTTYNCQQISCPSSVSEDEYYCKSPCTRRCVNGTCDYKGVCRCNVGFSNTQNSRYGCRMTTCPSNAPDDQVNCIMQCYRHCKNGSCDSNGVCRCNKGFKKTSNISYQCVTISCPSDADDDRAYCAEKCHRYCKNGVCNSRGACVCADGFINNPNVLYSCWVIQRYSPRIANKTDRETPCMESCLNGTCDDTGNCKCNEGFHRDPDRVNKCLRFACPASAGEDDDKCRTLCAKSCTNGICSANGSCNCSIGFKNPPGDISKCVKIECPSPTAGDKEYCYSLCLLTCDDGQCKEVGECICNEGFIPFNDIKGVCRRLCTGDQDCRLGNPRCSRLGYCTTSERYRRECTEKCRAGCAGNCDRGNCTLAGRGSESLETCAANCVLDVCEETSVVSWTAVAGGVVASLALIGVLVAFALWVRRRRRGHAWSGEGIPMTGVARDTGKTKTADARVCESYLEPRQFAQRPREDDSKYPYYETIETESSDVIGQAGSLLPRQQHHSYLQLSDLVDAEVVAGVPEYANLAAGSRENTYANVP